MNIPNSSDFCTRQLYAYAEHSRVLVSDAQDLDTLYTQSVIHGVSPTPQLSFDKNKRGNEL